MDLRKTGLKDINWVHLVYNKGKWRPFVNTVIDRLVPYKVGNVSS